MGSPKNFEIIETVKKMIFAVKRNQNWQFSENVQKNWASFKNKIPFRIILQLFYKKG